MPFRLDCNGFGGAILVSVREDIPCKQFTKHNLSENIEGIFVEINLRKVNLRKVQWFLFRAYHPN